MRAIKIILGLVCLAAAFFLGCPPVFGFIYWIRYHHLGSIGMLSAFASISLGLAVTGLFLIARRYSPMSNKSKTWIAGIMFVGILPVCFLCAQMIKTEKMAKEIKEECNNGLRQIEGVEQQWKLEQSKNTNDVPSVSEYELAQAVYRPFIHDRIIAQPHSGSFKIVPETNLVYCLCYGMSNSPLPSDFMSGFTNLTPRVITGTNTLIFRNDGAILERETGRPVVILALRGLVVKGDSADASIRYIDAERSIAQIFHYKKRDGQWTGGGGFSTGAPSRWGPNIQN
jgi:hypothetical protein